MARMVHEGELDGMPMGVSSGQRAEPAVVFEPVLEIPGAEIERMAKAVTALNQGQTHAMEDLKRLAQQ